MADFFNDQSDQNTAPVELEKIKLGDKEYTQEDLADLVKLGELGREIETRQNTKLDRVYPSLTKAQQELKEIKEQLEQQKQTPVDIDEETAIKEARAAAKKIGLVSTEEIQEAIRKEFPNYYQQQRESEKILEQAKGLEGKYDGKDGRPRFEAEDMLGFMRDSGINNAETAYKVRYEREIDQWKEGQLSKAKKTEIFTSDRPSDPKQPDEPRPTKDTLGAMIREQLYGSSE